MQSAKTKKEIRSHNGEESNQGLSEFEQLLDEYTYTAPKRGQIKEGEIKYIDEDSIIIDVGMKRDAVVYSSEINQLDEDYLKGLSIGDVIPIAIQRTPIGDEDLVVSVADALVYQNWEEVKKIKEEGDVVELEVVGENRGGLLVKFNRIEGFVPNSHISKMKKFLNRTQLTRKKERLVGENLIVTPIEVDRGNQRLVFSARAAEESVQEQRFEEIKEGEVITGKVVNIVDFGVFVDLGKVDGLVHLSELSWKRVKHPSDVLDIGDEIDVLVMNVDMDRNRIQLSRKALMQGPWDTIEENYVPGDLVEVKIVNVVDFGAFAQLPQGIHGLIHVSELGYASSGDPLKTVGPGDEVLVKILNIDRNRERISLSMRQVPLEAQYDWSLSKEARQEKNEEGQENDTLTEMDSSETEAAESIEPQEEPTESGESDETISSELPTGDEIVDEQIKLHHPTESGEAASEVEEKVLIDGNQAKDVFEEGFEDGNPIVEDSSQPKNEDNLKQGTSEREVPEQGPISEELEKAE